MDWNRQKGFLVVLASVGVGAGSYYALIASPDTPPLQEKCQIAPTHQPLVDAEVAKHISPSKNKAPVPAMTEGKIRSELRPSPPLAEKFRDVRPSKPAGRDIRPKAG